MRGRLLLVNVMKTGQIRETQPKHDGIFGNRAMEKHEQYMLTALALAEKGRLTTWPNPWVGCIIVRLSLIHI